MSTRVPLCCDDSFEAQLTLVTMFAPDSGGAYFDGRTVLQYGAERIQIDGFGQMPIESGRLVPANPKMAFATSVPRIERNLRQS